MKNLKHRNLKNKTLQNQNQSRPVCYVKIEIM